MSINYLMIFLFFFNCIHIQYGIWIMSSVGH